MSMNNFKKGYETGRKTYAASKSSHGIFDQTGRAIRKCEQPFFNTIANFYGIKN